MCYILGAGLGVLYTAGLGGRGGLCLGEGSAHASAWGGLLCPVLHYTVLYFNTP